MRGAEQVLPTSPVRSETCSLTAALAYAAAGWPVHPLRPRSKLPATSHGLRDATTDPVRVRAWWTALPDANIGIATGAPGPDVLDVDVKGGADGYRALDRVKRAGLLSGAFMVVTTASGGCHVYLHGSSEGNHTMPAHGLDFRGRGGYVVAAPSVVQYDSGVVGRVTVQDQADDPGIPLDWSAVRRLLDPPRAHRPPLFASGDCGGLARWVRALPEGNRNAGLFWAACRAAETGTSLDQLREADAAVGLADREVEATLRSAFETIHGASVSA